MAAITTLFDDTYTASEASAVVSCGAGFARGHVDLNFSNIEVDDNDEFAEFIVQLSTEANFATAALISDAASNRVGSAGGTNSPSDMELTSGEIAIPFTNVFNGTTYPYMRLYLLMGGTGPTVVLVAKVTFDSIDDFVPLDSSLTDINNADGKVQVWDVATNDPVRQFPIDAAESIALGGVTLTHP